LLRKNLKGKFLVVQIDCGIFVSSQPPGELHYGSTDVIFSRIQLKPNCRNHMQEENVIKTKTKIKCRKGYSQHSCSILLNSQSVWIMLLLIKEKDTKIVCCFVSQQPCAVCLEEFKTRDELGVCPCSHTFHKKWVSLEQVFT